MRVAIAGVGNCASALLQGLDHYRELGREEGEAWGLMHLDMGGYLPGDIEVVAAFDVDERKVGRPLHEAAFAPPNCTEVIRGAIAPSPVVRRLIAAARPLVRPDGVFASARDLAEATGIEIPG